MEITTVKELIERLEAIQNKDSKICFLGNTNNSSDEDDDVIFQRMEIWEDAEDSITLYVGMSEDEFKFSQKEFDTPSQD